MTAPHAPDAHLVDEIGTAILRQGTYWRARHPHTGQLHLVLVDALPAGHRANVLAWLRANADLMRAHEARALARAYKTGRLTAAAFAAAMRPLEAVPPEVWIEDTTLVRRLHELTAAEPARLRRPSRRLLPTRLRLPRWPR